MHARINVSIPSKLRERMQLRTKGGWSKVVTAALEMHLNGNDLLAEIQRLRKENERLREVLKAIHSLSEETP